MSATLGSTSAVADGSGRGVYLRHCAPCHGPEGLGDGPQAAYLSPKPRDFTTGLLHFRAGPAGAPATEADYERTIRRGVPSTSMPGWDRVLSDEQLRAVAAYVRAFAPPSTEVTAPLPVPEEAPPGSPEAQARGRAAFLLLGCWACHGGEARGDGPAAASPLIRPVDFTKGSFRSGGSALDLYRTLMTGTAGVPMPAFAQNLVLTRESAAALKGLRDKLPAEELRAVEAWAATLPTREQWDALPDEARQAASDGWRWDLVHYLLSVGRRGGLVEYLFDDPYVTR